MHANAVSAAMQMGMMPSNNSVKPEQRDFSASCAIAFVILPENQPRHWERRGLYWRPHHYRSVGINGTGLSLFRYLAAGHQHRHDYRDVSDGVPHSDTQNRDAKAMHLKLDELIRAVQGARNRLVDLEKLSDEELKQLEEQFTRLRNKAAQHASEVEEIEEEVRPRA